jgi:hypothetical protein
MNTQFIAKELVLKLGGLPVLGPQVLLLWRKIAVKQSLLVRALLRLQITNQTESLQHVGVKWSLNRLYLLRSRYNLTPKREETARLCLQRSNMADPLPQQDPAARAANSAPAPIGSTAPSVASKNPRSALAVAAKERMATKPHTVHFADTRDAQGDGGAAAAGPARGFKRPVGKRPRMARLGTSGGSGEELEGRAKERGNGSGFGALDSGPAGTPETSTQPKEETVQKVSRFFGIGMPIRAVRKLILLKRLRRMQSVELVILNRRLSQEGGAGLKDIVFLLWRSLVDSNRTTKVMLEHRNENRIHWLDLQDSLVA